MSMTEAQGKTGKSAGAFLTISEVSEELKVPQHVLRFWETKFTKLRPLKRAGGRRYYRPEDIDLLRQINDLLYNKGYTIRGAQKMLRSSGSVAETKETRVSTEDDVRLEPSTFAVKEPELPAMAPDVVDKKPESSGFLEEHMSELAAIRDELVALRKRMK
ncbi:MAG TPA: MerR family transcriptional regulator [Rhodospirillaceae bacterium]|nr:MAG: hypothetical protein A2018_03870 [Alphaproteobacteria bacterium GWF2_58_20]HAU29710.1 MerR family transcriptional regulator [Rhodospirillaceae bacterium]